MAAATELHAEHSVVWTTRQFPEHKAVLLPRYLLRRSGNPQSVAASRWRVSPIPRFSCLGGVGR